uniref:DNA/RNA-binding domain-containing protein n=1 Tax=Panagrolaimus sp. JU765 TaxID=591449 RepID=A0AC34PZB9_9BILA
MADGAQYDSGENSAVGTHKKRPDQQIYRPGMFKRGIDLTQTKPKVENQPPQLEKKLQQVRRKENNEREKNRSLMYIPNQKYHQTLPPTGRERTYSDAPNGYPPNTNYSRRGGGGGGGYRSRDNFDSRSVRSNRQRQTYRPSKFKPPIDTRSEMGQNDDTQSIASTTFSTDTTGFNNGFASELNSRQASFQSLLSADLQNFDWAEAAFEDDFQYPGLEKLPETDSNGHQEDDLSSEKTPTSTPRKVSVTVEQIAKEQPSTLVIPTSGAQNDEKIQKTKQNEFKPKIKEEINDFKENEENKVPEMKIIEKIPKVEAFNGQFTVEANDGSFTIKTPIDRTVLCLKLLNNRLASLDQSDMLEMTESELIEYLKNLSEDYNSLLQNIFDSKNTLKITGSNEEFKSCALEAMKVRQQAERIVKALLVKRTNYALSIVTDIIMKSLFIVSALLVFNLEEAKKYQMIDAFEGIWQKLISTVKTHVTLFGKNVVIQLIALMRSSISKLSEYMKVDEYLDDFIKAVLSSDLSDFSKAFILPENSKNPFDCPENILNFAGIVYQWHGDLSRYQSMILGSTDYDPSLKFYLLSFVFDPNCGKSLNQMGAVASYKTPSELLNAVFLFSHALTTKKPFLGSETKLISLLDFQNNGHDSDSNIERLAFTQHFLYLANKAFNNDLTDLSLATDKVISEITEIFSKETETTVFTSLDLVYQIGIFWNLINTEKIEEQPKNCLKKVLMVYLEHLAGNLLNLAEVDNPTDVKTKLEFIASPLSVLAQVFPHIGGNKIPSDSLDLSWLNKIMRALYETDQVSQIILPESLLILHGNKDYPSKNFLLSEKTTDPSSGAILGRLSIITDFLNSFTKE